MANYQLTDEARQDLVDIRRFTMQNWGDAQSKIYLRRLQETLRTLAEMPTLGKSRALDVAEGVLSFPYVSHMVYYQPGQKGIIILAVLHQSRVPATHLATRL
ncbi:MULTISPECIES: type II toxin-antitoxin system RelE/ParE family toxin [Pantoea]|jgi:toxin ParE1/3/4|uniref:type II toxin-antitoxin system RelE/ParE family toxin n=1 Tax=Pantoea TaxID=53335 RepID=UPI001782F967|nr:MULTISPECIES: type II toxin-antitoxin system RelE/ParE family toxin [Pantoea]MBD9643748.1 type II toxin-antitoxin system RelE/ParE family toxin [Pantoea sp. PNT02]WFL67031.1 type II toxin-antitoxin system RelE/ParE family toxin [Pantoea sp. X85]WGK56778.1 type II toxin-antitoxin system RelE/ParE family toxin [Pantoea sp. SS70]